MLWQTAQTPTAGIHEIGLIGRDETTGKVLPSQTRLKREGTRVALCVVCGRRCVCTTRPLSSVLQPGLEDLLPLLLLICH